MTATADRVACPVCAAACVPLGAVDFNKSCEEVRGFHLPPAGRLVSYVICPACQFSFAPEFAAWSPEDFGREIYNEGYSSVDPDHADARPRANAESLLATFGDQGRTLRHLDYGGGAGLLSTLLGKSGWNSTSYDPFFDRSVQLQKLGTFQLITCFEVFEHVPDVNGLAGNLSSLLAEDGLILFSTLVSDGELRRGQPMTWWYASPRNGHISLYSTQSLNALAQKHGFGVASFSPGMHLFWRQQFPPWARHLLQGRLTARSPVKIQDALQSAIAHHQAGQFAEAETLYRQILAQSPGHPDALHFTGLLAHHRGQHAAAVDLMNQALRVAPDHAPCHCNLGSALQALGRVDEAIASYRHALALKRDFAEAHLNLGNALQVKGLPDEAVASYRRALRHKPHYAEAYYNLGRVYQAQGRYAPAVSAYRRAVSIQPDYAEAHNNLGNTLRADGRLDEAIASYQKALAVQPGHVEAHNNLGLAYQANGRPDDARASLEQALALRPDYAEAHNNLGSVLAAEGLHTAAISRYRQALVLKPDFAEAHNNLGNAFLTEGDLAESIASYRRALASRPEYAEALNNLGNALQTVGQPDEAIGHYEQALALKPGMADALWNQAFALLLKGDYAAGWPLYEWRWQAIGKHGALRDFAAPLWLGESPLAGRTILLHHEQGLGDTLQMLRYVPLLAAQGARVVVEVPPALVTIATSVPGAATVVVQGQPLPAFDVHCPCMSLPLAFRTTLESVPASVPYLSVTATSRNAWRERLGLRTGRRVGLAFAGSTTHSNDRHRSLPLRYLLPLLDAEAGFFSLQKDYRPDDSTVLAEDGRLRDCSAHLGDLADTAGLIDQLDLVITVDTAVAHLAGGLGKPVWLLLPYAPDYRWLLQRTDSPWYPTMRLFRQPVFGDWDAVIRSVSGALADGG